MKASDVSRIAVIGAGTMGAGIAGEFARVGCEVRLAGTENAILREGLRRLRAAQKALSAAGRLSETAARAARARITTTTDAEAACAGVHLVVEAVSETLPLKKKMFRAFDRASPKSAILASNTSGLSITEIASATARPTKVAGLHF
jgi:3-hydroxyacyl-CoA dehydrogenase